MSAERLRATTRALTLVVAIGPLTACEWFTDFKRQPYVTTWEALDSAGVRGSPQMSVPITGTAVAGFAVSYAPMPATIDSMAGLVNPVPADSASLANGRKHYMISCAVCHSVTGAGDGPATKYGVFPFPLASGPALGRTDGYIFGMIRNGRGNMPSYNRIEERDRWDVVNYVRGLQGRTGTPVATGALAVPGYTGAALPGASELGPTRPVPHTAAAMDALGARRGGSSADTTALRSPTDTTRSGASSAPRQGERQ